MNIFSSSSSQSVYITIIIIIIILITSFFSTTHGQLEHRLDYTISENQPIGLQIGYISKDVVQSLMKNNQNNDKTFFDESYSFYLRDKNKYFTLDPKKSVLKTAAQIDLEQLCPKYCDKSGVGILTLVVNIFKEKQLRGVITVGIVILDQNDNKPQFPMKTFNKSIKEILYGKGKYIEIPKAIDNDVALINKKVTYKLTEQSEMFELDVTPDQQPRLKLLKDVDYEEKSNYLLTLAAWNEIKTDIKSYLQINITIVDLNDCEPKFEKRVIEAVIDENAKIGKIVTKLKATDQDKSSHITYSMGVGASEVVKRTFWVRPNGEVVLKATLDVEREREFEFVVSASDGEFRVNAKLRVMVQDVNNHPPSYSLNPSTLTVLENQQGHTLVGQITVKDLDSPEVNGMVRCQEPSGRAELQTLEFLPNPAHNPSAMKFDLYTRSALDRESSEGPERIILLICHDGGLHARLTSTLSIRLRITDVNDNPPKFRQQRYNVSIAEGNNIGDKVFQVVAEDADYGENAKILYSLRQSSSSLFSIDSNTGWISAMRILDREEIGMHNLLVMATNPPVPIDHNSGGIRSKAPPVTATTEIVVTVSDINDNIPHVLPPTQFSVRENGLPHQHVGDIIARDNDAGSNGTLFFLLDSVQYGSKFNIQRNGSIFTRISFDREKKERYCMGVRVSDLGVPKRLSVTTTICVTILDENDNSPKIQVISMHQIIAANTPQAEVMKGGTNSSKDLVIASVHEVPGQKIATVTAIDPDKDNNAKCTFILEDADMRSNRAIQLFMIDDEDGSIKISRVMSRDNIGQYRVRIAAQDMGLPSLRGEHTITIDIRDIPPQSAVDSGLSSSSAGNFSFSGNVLIVVVLSIVSAFLTALLIGAILCMIRPCCSKRASSSSASHHGSAYPTMDCASNRNSQTLLQKLSPNDYYHIDSTISPRLDNSQTWNDTISREYYHHHLASQNVALECFGNNNYQQNGGDYLPYEMSENICSLPHLIGKPNGCACGQAACARYGNNHGNHSSTYCLLNPEEQCSDSGRGASDDDMRNFSHAGITSRTADDIITSAINPSHNCRISGTWRDPYSVCNATPISSTLASSLHQAAVAAAAVNQSKSFSISNNNSNNISTTTVPVIVPVDSFANTYNTMSPTFSLRYKRSSPTSVVPMTTFQQSNNNTLDLNKIVLISEPTSSSSASTLPPFLLSTQTINTNTNTTGKFPNSTYNICSDHSSMGKETNKNPVPMTFADNTGNIFNINNTIKNNNDGEINCSTISPTAGDVTTDDCRNTINCNDTPTTINTTTTTTTK